MNWSQESVNKVTEALDTLWVEGATVTMQESAKAALSVIAELPEVKGLQNIVNEQAEDECLWFNAETAAEAYLQQEFRRLHAVIEALTGGNQ